MSQHGAPCNARVWSIITSFYPKQQKQAREFRADHGFFQRLTASRFSANICLTIDTDLCSSVISALSLSLSLSLLITGRRARAIRTRSFVAFRRRHASARRGRHAGIVHVRRYCVVLIMCEVCTCLHCLRWRLSPGQSKSVSVRGRNDFFKIVHSIFHRGKKSYGRHQNNYCFSTILAFF
jgi:hypothetical protein